MHSCVGLRLCVVLTILSVHLSGQLTRSLNERSKGRYTAHREQECVITLYIDDVDKLNLLCVQQLNYFKICIIKIIALKN